MKRFLIVFALVGCSSSGGTTDAAPDQKTMMMDSGTESGTSCNAAIEMILKPVDMVSTGEVSIVSESNGVKTLYVDATAGGFGMSETNPRVYVDLTAGKRVDITDVQARTSMAWDLSFKRYVIFTNGGTGGPGMGGELTVFKAFDQVTAADATAKFATEMFVDSDCNQLMDPLGGLLTTMSDWYDYNQQTMAVSPKNNTTFIVRGASGKLFKMAVVQYYGASDGGMSMTGARFVLKVAAL